MKPLKNCDINQRNRAVERAFLCLTKAAKTIIAERSDERERCFIELRQQRVGSVIPTTVEFISRRFYLLLDQDDRGDYRISFGIDPRSEHALNVRLLGLLCEHTRRKNTLNIENCLCLDQVFLNTAELFEIAFRRQSVHIVPGMDIPAPSLKN